MRNVERRTRERQRVRIILLSFEAPVTAIYIIRLNEFHKKYF
jgi:hypothetical protein